MALFERKSSGRATSLRTFQKVQISTYSVFVHRTHLLVPHHAKRQAKERQEPFTFQAISEGSSKETKDKNTIKKKVRAIDRCQTPGYHAPRKTPHHPMRIIDLVSTVDNCRVRSRRGCSEWIV